MKRLTILGAVLVAAACAQEPPPPVAAAAPPDVAAPPAPALAAFDGRYAGSMTIGVSDVAFSTVTHPYCADERINMTIRNGYATVSYEDWKQHTLHYRGQVDPGGTVNMSHLNGNGVRSVFTLKMSGDHANGQLQRGHCWYDVSMTRV